MDDYPASEPIPNPVGFQFTELAEFLAHNSDMRKAVRGSIRQGLYSGGGAVAGGLLFGPIGGLVGGVTGALFGFLQTDDYDGMVQSVLKLDVPHQQRLVESVRGVLTTAGASAARFESPEAFHNLLVEMASQPSVREQIWQTCVEAVQSP